SSHISSPLASLPFLPMQCCQFLLVTLFAILASSTISADTSRDDHDGVSRGAGLQRFSNSGRLTKEKREERGIFSGIKNWVKMKYWVSLKKSDKYVMEKLGLQGLQGQALRTHPKYKTLEKFWYKRESSELDDWFNEGLTLYGAWTRLKLDKVPSAQVMKTNEYKTYVHYVKKYDSMVYNFKNGIWQPPIEFGGTDAEIFAKVQVWAAAKRPRWYVKEMLELDGLSKSELVADKFYKKFLDLTGKKP
ncbi:hypothetical protein F441_00427, partial [Phytophthora nicotianae CJ01A1]